MSQPNSQIQTGCIIKDQIFKHRTDQQQMQCLTDPDRQFSDNLNPNQHEIYLSNSHWHVVFSRSECNDHSYRQLPNHFSISDYSRSNHV